MIDKDWFYKKWNINSHSSLINYIEKLEARIEKLEQENIETTNFLYELQNTIEAVDRRVDITSTSEVKYLDLENDFNLGK